MKVNVLIIEDEFPARRTLKSYLHRYFPSIEVIGEATSLLQAKELIAKGGFDFMFLDVHLKDGRSVDMLDELDIDNLRIIFTTAYRDYTLEAFTHKAFGYLLKPINPIVFKEIVNRVLKDVLHGTKELIKLKVYTSNKFAFIDTTEIVRCEAESNYATIKCVDGNSYMVSKTLKALEEELRQTEKFVRIHKSHLVNIDFVNQRQVSKTQIVLTNGEELPVSRVGSERLINLIN